MKCGALILAAGASTRPGHPRQLVRLGNETFLDLSVRIAREAGCAPIVVVPGASENQIRDQCKLQDVLIVSHPEWAEGMGTTIARGVRAFEDVQRVLVMTCDMPSIIADHLLTLAASEQVAASSYGGRKGVPAYFPRDRFPIRLELKRDEGARELLQFAHGVEFPGGEPDVDTSEAFGKSPRYLRLRFSHFAGMRSAVELRFSSYPSSAGDCSNDKERLFALDHLSWQWIIWRERGKILLTREEANEWTTELTRVVSDCPLKHGVGEFKSIENCSLCHCSFKRNNHFSGGVG